MRIHQLLRRLVKSRGGFTLVELLISITIFGILMIAFVSLFINALYITVRAGSRDTAVSNISGELEKQIAEPDADYVVKENLPDGVTIHFDAVPAATPETVDVNRYTGSWEMNDGTEVEMEYIDPVTAS